MNPKIAGVEQSPVGHTYFMNKRAIEIELELRGVLLN